MVQLMSRLLGQKFRVENMQVVSSRLKLSKIAAGGTIYNTHMLEPFTELVLEFQRVKCFRASCSFCQLRCQTCPY